ncbi:FG-GAP-like repeat-containing protein [Winogradskyella aurantiaca]|uniref:FG-GAP-like repeat-containing protein n=1 Tax=Winogradskyella aurantiaca TaxID=2219558 RepID=UPI000E1DB13E|nr:FG-GAP-like repeat-containing protein [Winogradskyella aurantiaca]
MISLIKSIKCKKLTHFIILFSLLGVARAQTTFTNVSEAVGVDVIVGNTALGNGISFVDFNKDGWDDISVCTGPNDTPKFYLNIDGIFFTEVNLNLGIQSYQNKQICWVDYDNDGDRDLFITSNTYGNRLFNNTGNLIFEEVTEASGIETSNVYTNGASWADVNNDGCLDLYLSNHTGTESGVPNLFYQSNCDGTFTEVSEEIGLFNRLAPSFCSGFFDYNNDGWLDLYVANDRFSANFLYKNNGDGTFSDVSEESNTGVVMDAMTVTVDDFNSDGYFDMYVTNTPEHVSTPFLGNALFKNETNETFENVSETAGTMFYGFAWGASFIDVENDGDMDLYVSSSYDGTVMDYPSFALYENIGNLEFVQNTQMGFEGDNHVSYGNAVGDINNDGLLDIIVLNNNNDIPCVWENKNAEQGNYLKLNLIGTESNIDGIGARIEISANGQVQYRHVMCGEGYLSQHSFVEQFGVGDASSIDYVKVNWPSGIEDILNHVEVNQKINIVEGASLSMDENFSLSYISLYPTIVRDKVTVEVNAEEADLFLFNGVGQLIKRLKVNAGLNELQLDQLNSGVYLAVFDFGDRSKVTKKIVKY